MPFLPPQAPPRENGKPRNDDESDSNENKSSDSDINANSTPRSSDLHDEQSAESKIEESANEKPPEGDSSAQEKKSDDTEETLADALRKLISHRFKQKVDQQRNKKLSENQQEELVKKPEEKKLEEKKPEAPKKSLLKNSEKTLSRESTSSRSSRGSKKSMQNSQQSQSSRKSHLGARRESSATSAFDFNSDSELSDYAVEVEIRSACSDYSYDEWIEDSNDSDDGGDPFNLETFKSMPNIKTIREPHSETMSSLPDKKEPVQKSVDFAHEKVNIGNRKVWKRNSNVGLARHSFANIGDAQRAYTLSRDPSRDSFASYTGMG